MQEVSVPEKRGSNERSHEEPDLHSLVEQRLIERNKKNTERAPEFQVGDTVRINLTKGKNTFDRRLIKWSKEIYPVQRL